MNIDQSQTVFTLVWEHLRSQDWIQSKAAGYDNRCANRGENGRRCAIGCLLSEEELDRIGENTVWSETAVMNKYGVDRDFLIQLRACHDNGNTPAMMRENFELFASEENLRIP